MRAVSLLSVGGYVILSHFLWFKGNWCNIVQQGIKYLSQHSKPYSSVNVTFIVTFWRCYMVMIHCSSNFCTMFLWALPICHDSISLGIADERIKIRRENKKSISNGFQIPLSYTRELNIALILWPSRHITQIKTSKLFKILLKAEIYTMWNNIQLFELTCWWAVSCHLICTSSELIKSEP